MTAGRVTGLATLVPDLRRASLRPTPRPGARAALALRLRSTAQALEPLTVAGDTLVDDPAGDGATAAPILAQIGHELRRAALVLDNEWSPADLTATADRIDAWNYRARRVSAGRIAARMAGTDPDELTEAELVELATPEVLAQLDHGVGRMVGRPNRAQRRSSRR